MGPSCLVRRRQPGKRSSRGLVLDLAGLGEVEDAGFDKVLDGLLDESGFGFVFECGLDLVFKGLARGRTWSGGIF